MLLMWHNSGRYNVGLRDKLIYLFAAVAGVLLVWNLYTMFYVLPDELNQGPVYRIFFFHVPSLFVGMIGLLLAMVASVGYLTVKDFRYDEAAAAMVEVALTFMIAGVVGGSIWARSTWGIWWTWDARLTSTFACILLAAGYLMLRKAIEDPTARARLSAVLCIFAGVDVVIVWKSIEWFRTQHPAPVLAVRGGGGMAPGMEAAMYWNFLALGLLAAALVLMRMRQERIGREIDALRRTLRERE
ncbi:MAG: cytochrome c biogenesis protein CcsA [Bryobacteraceae bacterium]